MAASKPLSQPRPSESAASALEKLTTELSALCEEKPLLLNAREQIAMRAMIAYAAYDQGVREDVVTACLQRKFGFADAAHVTREAYDDVVRFLVDLDVRQSNG